MGTTTYSVAQTTASIQRRLVQFKGIRFHFARGIFLCPSILRTASELLLCRTIWNTLPTLISLRMWMGCGKLTILWVGPLPPESGSFSRCQLFFYLRCQYFITDVLGGMFRSSSQPSDLLTDHLETKFHASGTIY